MSDVVRNRLCMECLRDGVAALCPDPRKHLREAHPHGTATMKDMVPVYDSGKVHPGSCGQLRQVQKHVTLELISKLGPDDRHRLERLLELVDQFLPVECGGSRSRTQ